LVALICNIAQRLLMDNATESVQGEG